MKYCLINNLFSLLKLSETYSKQYGELLRIIKSYLLPQMVSVFELAKLRDLLSAFQGVNQCGENSTIQSHTSIVTPLWGN